MLLAMVEDIRVVLIKLAERTQTLRFLMNGDEAMRRERRARGAWTSTRRSPTGSASGSSSGSSRTCRSARSSPRVQAHRAAARRAPARSRALHREVVSLLRQGARRRSASRAEVSGRPKHIYSIWRKMQRKQVGIDALYDMRAVRVLVDAVRDCYAALGVVHHLWTPLAGRVRRLHREAEGEQLPSLHTAVIGPEGKPLEVQIRTHEMHQHAEYGVAAHWRYKEGGAAAERRDAALRRQDRVAAPAARLEGRGRRHGRMAVGVSQQPVHRFDLRADAAGQGRRPAARRDADRLRLRGAHDLGHRCRGARVDGQMVPLDTRSQRPAGRDHRGEAGRARRATG